MYISDLVNLWLAIIMRLAKKILVRVLQMYCIYIENLLRGDNVNICEVQSTDVCGP
jgi:hypothetical protein